MLAVEPRVWRWSHAWSMICPIWMWWLHTKTAGQFVCLTGPSGVVCLGKHRIDAWVIILHIYSSVTRDVRLVTESPGKRFTHKELIGRLAKALNACNVPNYFPTAIWGSNRATKCLLEKERTLWLSSSITVETFRQFLSATKGNITGPASHLDDSEMEIIVTLMCVGPVPVIREFHCRPRQCGWPRTQTMSQI